MKNADKIIKALRETFPGHRVETYYNNVNAKILCVFVDDNYVGNFEDRFSEMDFDNPEIEIKIKAPIYNIRDFLEEVECDGVFYRAVERGLKEWEKGSQQNS